MVMTSSLHNCVLKTCLNTTMLSDTSRPPREGGPATMPYRNGVLHENVCCIVPPCIARAAQGCERCRAGRSWSAWSGAARQRAMQRGLGVLWALRHCWSR